MRKNLCVWCMLDRSVGQLAGACGIGMYYYYKAKDNHQYDKKVCLTFNKVVYVIGRQWRPKLDL